MRAITSNQKRNQFEKPKRTMSKAIEILTNKFIQDVKNLWELERQRVNAKGQVERNLMECEDINMIVKEVEKLKKPKKVKKVMIDDDPILPNEPQFNPVTKEMDNVKKVEKPKKVKKVMIDDDPILPNEPQFNPVTKKIDRNELPLHDRVVYDWLEKGGINIHGSPNARYVRIYIDMNGLDYIADDDGRIKPEGYYYYKDLEFWGDDVEDELEMWFKTADMSQKFASKNDKVVSDFGYEKLLRKKQLRHIVIDDKPVIPKKEQREVKVGDFIFRFNKSGVSKVVFGKVVRITDKFTEIVDYVSHKYYTYDGKVSDSWETFDMEMTYTSKTKIPKNKDMLIITDEKGYRITDAHFRGWGYK